MRLAACAPLLFASLILLAGCSSPGKDTATESLQQGTDGGSTVLRDAPPDMPVEEPTARVEDPVEFSGLIGAGACVFDGSGISCANLPSLTPPSPGGSNVLVYHHARIASALDGGDLLVAWSPHVGMGLSAHVLVYAGCPHECQLVEEIAAGSSSLDETGAATQAGFPIEVPPYDLQQGQTLAVRIAPLLATSLASAHTGYDVELSGTLAFEVVE